MSAAGAGSGNGTPGKVTELVARSLDDTWEVAKSIAAECREGDLILCELPFSIRLVLFVFTSSGF